MHDRPAAHDAGLQRHIQCAAGQTVVAQCLRRIAQGHDFGMGRRIVPAYGLVVAAPDDLAVLDDDRTDGHLAEAAGGMRQFQRRAHELFVHAGDCNPLRAPSRLPAAGLAAISVPCQACQERSGCRTTPTDTKGGGRYPDAMDRLSRSGTRDGLLFGLALLALALAAFVYAFQWKLLRDPINRYVSEKTGRHFAINGDFQVRLGSTTDISLRQVEFANPDWARDPTMAKADLIVVSVNLPALLG